MGIFSAVSRLARSRTKGASGTNSPRCPPTDVAEPGWFIGLSTDRAFVTPSCAMLSSLEDNGEVPEATVLVASFGLSDTDREALRLSAGRLGEGMRFVELSADSPKIVARPTFDFPWPLVGRFVLPGEVHARGARLLLIDSDMVVNSSLRPLFESDMGGYPLAAVHDPGKPVDYLNAGLMLIDLDVFNGRRIGDAAMRRLAAYADKPRFVDQDALNDVLAGEWLRLDRTWNFFYAEDPRHFELSDYEAAAIIHFAGPKPWEDFGVTPLSLYERHALRAQHKQPRLQASLDDLACGKPALSSSTSRWSRASDRSVDARGANSPLIAATYGFHTGGEDEPWWQVDLLQVASVTGVAILNRPTHVDRFSSFMIETSTDDIVWTVAHTKDDDEPVSAEVTSPWRVDFSEPMSCRYVRIRSRRPGPLHLRRVQVFGHVIEGGLG